jgi:hypothetical protein
MGATTGAKQTKGSEHIGQESIMGDGMSQYSSPDIALSHISFFTFSPAFL